MIAEEVMRAWQESVDKVLKCRNALSEAILYESKCRTAALKPLGLSIRQQQVLSMIQLGLSNKEISTALNISVRTVKFHVSILLRIYKVTNRHNLFMAAA